MKSDRQIVTNGPKVPESLPPELQQFVERELASGRYKSVDDVICDALRLLRERKRYELREAIDIGLQTLEEGEGIELEDERSVRAFFDDVKQRGSKRLAANESGE
jgi:putative addiction module CopG family antidote